MPSVGDTVQVTIRGGDEGSTSLGGAITIAQGEAMTVAGKIVADNGDAWTIELNLSIGGRNRIIVPKSAQI